MPACRALLRYSSSLRSSCLRLCFAPSRTVFVPLMRRSRNETMDVRSISGPYAPYASPGLPLGDYADAFNQASSRAHAPLVANDSPFQTWRFLRRNMRTVNRHVLTISTTGVDWHPIGKRSTPLQFRVLVCAFEEHAPNVDKEGSIAKEALAGERRWVLVRWVLTW